MFNCQGIKEKFETPDFQKLISTKDIFGICETWLKDGDESVNVPGFNFYPLNRKREKGVTRGGLGVFIRHEFKEYVKVMYDISTENILWCKIVKSFLNFNEDLYVGIVYFPPEYSSREKRLQNDHFLNLSERTSTIPSEKIILLGDFNARTGRTEDRLLKDKHDSDDTPLEFFSHIKEQRYNQDNKENKYGKNLLDYCAQTQSYIANGRTLGDFQGRLTCYETRGSSTVDYAIIKESIKRIVKKFMVLQPSYGSDHCPIILDVSYNPSTSLQYQKEKLTKMKPKIKWDENTKNIFCWHMNSPKLENDINNLENIIDNRSKEIDKAAEKVTHIFMYSLGK